MPRKGPAFLWLCLSALFCACDALDPPAPLAHGTFAACCAGRSTCVPSSLVTAKARSQLSRESCDAALLCAPNEMLQTSHPPFAVCEVPGLGAEGRCLPSCLPQVTTQAERLSQGSCQSDERCVPCFDPIDGSATHACDQGTDPGPTAEPRLFGECCEELGRCLPGELVPSELQAALGREQCAERELCVPKAALAQSYVPQRCEVSALGAEGRCLPNCLPAVASMAELVQRDGCAEGHSCAPCFDPRSGASTGACEQGQDPGPREPPKVFASCCEDLGRCVPPAWVPSDVAEQLARDTCDNAQLCAPKQALDPAYAPQVCVTSALHAEGRCLPACLPPLAKLSAQLTRDGCTEGHLCAPCFDPRSGESTSACNLARDPGPSEPPITLAACCGALGRCVPRSWIPNEAASLLGPDQCRAADQLCVAPAAMLDDPQGFVLEQCHDPLTRAEGRCLPSCLPPVAERAVSLRQGDCADAFLCVPCFDPVSGEPSGACGQGADPGPSEPGVMFERCCAEQGESLGMCVPSALLPADVTALGPEACAGRDVACVPKALVETLGSHLPACTSLLSVSGGCVPKCLLSISQTLLLPQDVCAGAERCAPCSTLGDACPP